MRTRKYRHAGRNSLLPVVTMTEIRLGRLVTGVFFIEVVFAYPGMGFLTHQALLSRDYPLLQDIFLVTTVSMLFANYTVEALYPKLDPRIRHAD